MVPFQYFDPPIPRKDLSEKKQKQSTDHEKRISESDNINTLPLCSKLRHATANQQSILLAIVSAERSAE